MGELKIPNSKYTTALAIGCRTQSIDNTTIYKDVFGYVPVFCLRFKLKSKDANAASIKRQKIYDDMLHDGYVPYCVLYSNVGSDYSYDEDEEDNENVNKDFSLADFVMLSPEGTPNMLVECEYDSIVVYTHENIDVAKEYIKKYAEKHVDEDFEVKCHIIVRGDYLYLNDFEIKLDGPLDFSLYNEGFEDIHNEILKSIKEDSNGCYILHGEAGTGKTTYIRHLIKEYKNKYGNDKKFVYIPSSLVSELTSPVFLTFLVENKNCVFILEDCENLVTTTNGVRSSVISDMLNMTDGILSDALKLKFIITFNTEEKEIDQALLREGRCRCKYTFDLLNKDRAIEVAKKRNLAIPDKDISLAELFNGGKNRFQNKKKKTKIGFNA